MVRTAVILGAGRGTRLRPMTDTVPKILVPVRGTPLCDRIVDSLIEAGIERIIFIVGYLSERIVEHYGRHPHSAKFEYIEQATLDGTGGAVRLALPVVEEDFLVIFGDSLFARNAVASVVNAPARNAIGVVEVPDPERFGIVTANAQGTIVEIEEKPEAPRSNLAVAGIYKFSSDAKRYFSQLPLSRRGEYEMPDAIRMMIDDGIRVSAVTFDGMFDVGTLSQVEALETMDEDLFTAMFE
ncbi:sugar phosphate nucleotidyltransferase [Stappia sp. ES.058]|uniref:sugar phosphate nucleotidyltransferase n=1 Tax=Stappia sp. ES.058 TaxID=1881061 RepID=UPI00087D6C33|nr:sugar phosphate nucleotidyltransferase [Stappia sp. ES.058]SDU49508.1 glucose-1-phosphate thymidylyltransferase/bifunctional UDP-N-acetylglucosamine pyrophosphorylase / Glucosamine-1-phosphate N-acetyltransferase [Stappia sp. ES.058]